MQNLNQGYREKIKVSDQKHIDYERMYNDIKTRFTDLDKSNKTLINSKKEFVAKNKELETKWARSSVEIENLTGYKKRLEK